MPGPSESANDPAIPDDSAIIVGRDDAAAPEDMPEDDGDGTGHPLPASEKARHGSIPESIERSRGHGAN